ncbi:hypothetical protein, partial [Streptococcus pluranimalium]
FYGSGDVPDSNYPFGGAVERGIRNVFKRCVLNVGFTVKKVIRNIPSAYDLWYRNAVGTNSANLSLERNKRETAYFQFQASVPWLTGPSWNGPLSAQVDADPLVTYVM